jgi:hypothetical protein
VALFTSLIVGAVMIAKGMRLVFSGDPQAAYATGGTLKPTQAVTMHAIMVLPLLAWLLAFADWPERRRVRVVWLATVAYMLLAGGVAFENVVGLSASEVPTGSVALIASGVIGLLTASVIVLNGVLRTAHGRRLKHE